MESRKTVAGVIVTPESALYSTAVLACVRVLAESIASMPMNLFRRLPTGGREIADGHPLQELLAYQPNSWMTSFEWREWMMAQLLLWGNAYCKIVSGGSGPVTALEPVHASRVIKIERTETGRLRYLIKEDDTKPEGTPYTQDKIFHLRWLSSDGIMGYIPTELSRDAIALARAAELYSSAFFGNGAQGGTYFETSEPVKPEARREFKNQWDAANKGPENQFKTFVLPFPYKKVPNDVDNQKNSLIETRRYQLEECARSYRVPLHMLGDLTNVRQSTAEQSAIDFVTFSLMPHTARWKHAIRRDLIVDYRNYFVDFDVSSLLLGDHQARAQYLREAFSMGALDIDEIRARIGENPLPGEEGKKRFVPVNMQLIQAFSENPKDSQTTTESDDGTPTPEPQDDSSEDGTPSSDEASRAHAADLLFRSTLRRLAAIEADGILERRNKPAKLKAWFEAHEERMKNELRDAANASSRDIDAFVVQWMAETRERLLDCQRSGTTYEEALKSWTDRANLSDG